MLEEEFYEDGDEIEDFSDEDFEDNDDDAEDDEPIQINLPRPFKAQRKILASKARFKVLLCGRRFGKTAIAQILTIETMLDGGQVAYVTPEFGLGKEFFTEIVKYLPKKIIATDNKSDLFIQLKTGGSVRFFSGEALENFRGRKFHLAVIDEAAKIPNLQQAWGSAIRPTLMDYKGKALFISTPRGQNFFYALYLKGVNKEEGFESFHYTTYENPYLSKDEVDQMKVELNDAQFREEVLAEPIANSANPFGVDNIKKNIVPELSKEPTIVFGIDLASRMDYTVIIGLDAAGSTTHFERFQLDWVTTMNKIKQLPNDVLKVIDSTGVGNVVFDELQYSCDNVKPFTFTTTTKPAIINQLINSVQKGEIKYNEMTATEMNVFEYKRTSTGHIKFEAQAGFHDDCVCALAIANYHKYTAFSNTNWKLYTV